MSIRKDRVKSKPEEVLVNTTLRLRRWLYDRARCEARARGHESVSAWIRTLVIQALGK